MGESEYTNEEAYDEDEYEDGSFQYYVRRFAIRAVQLYFTCTEKGRDLKENIFRLQSLFNSYYKDNEEDRAYFKSLFYHYIGLVGGKRRLDDFNGVFDEWVKHYNPDPAVGREGVLPSKFKSPSR